MKTKAQMISDYSIGHKSLNNFWLIQLTNTLLAATLYLILCIQKLQFYQLYPKKEVNYKERRRRRRSQTFDKLSTCLSNDCELMVSLSTKSAIYKRLLYIFDWIKRTKGQSWLKMPVKLVKHQKINLWSSPMLYNLI